MSADAAELRRIAGLAHVASLSFLATRLAPPLGFGLSLAGGVALARAAASGRLRSGYATAWAAVLETVAMVGPNRLGGPVTQALSAPLLGRMHARGRSRVLQVTVAGFIRFAYNAATTAFFIGFVAGGVSGYAAAYGNAAGWIPGVPSGPLASLLVTVVALAAWAGFGATVQVVTFSHALRRWPPPGAARPTQAEREEVPAHPARFDPRAVATASLIAFGILLFAAHPRALAASALCLGLLWAVSRPDRDVLPSGLTLALVLAALAAGISALGGNGAEETLRLAARAGLLVLWATWLRAASGDRGFREVSRRALWRLRGLPTARETGTLLAEMGPERRIAPAARQLADVGKRAPRTPMGIVDAVLDWIAVEAARFRSELPPRVVLRLRVRDTVPPLAALAPLAVLLA
jgi:hypothetical protein